MSSIPILGSVSRRQMLKGAAATALAIGTGTIGAGPKVFAAEPKKGGSVRLGLIGGSTTDSLDPATYTGGMTVIAMWGAVCNNLAEIDATGNAIPELAASWEPSKDAKSWAFKIRSGVEFHNGKTLTPADVIASINYHRGADTKSGAKSILESVESIRADGSDTVIFDLKIGNADFPFVTADYHLCILPEKDGSIDWQSGIGTGGYRLQKFEPGVRIILKRNPNYWKTGRAHFDDVEIISIADVAARMTALVTGEVDIIDRVDLKSINRLSGNKNIVIEEVTGTSHFTLPMFCDTAPFSDVNVRLALKYAIDREELVKKVLLGHGRVGNDQPIAPANRFFNAGLEQRRFDPDKARYHLKAAGLETLKVDLHAADAAFEGALSTALLFQGSAAKAGIDINVVREPDDGYWSNVWLKKPFCLSYWNGRPTEDWMFSLVYAADAAWNDAHWKNERFNQLLVAARSELDEAKRRQMYYEMQAIVSDDGGTIIPMYANYLDAHSTRIANDGKIAANSWLDGWKAIERWWVA